MKMLKLTKKTWVYVSNVIYTEPGIMQGFTLKILSIYWFGFRKFRKLRIPFWIMGYDRETAQEINALYDKIKQQREEER